MPFAARVAGAIVLVLVVLVILVLARARGKGPSRWLWAGFGVGAAAAGAVGLAGLARPSSAPRRTGGAGASPASHGEALTPAENAAVEALARARLPMEELPASLDDLGPGLPYRAAFLARRLAHHDGQRKLLLAEVAFLTDHLRRGDTVVYAGSAPGTHIPYLASLFPEASFVLYDPRKFKMPKSRRDVQDRISTHREPFTDALAGSYAGRDDTLFISDIRSGDPVGPQGDDIAAADMRAQDRWVALMNPRAALLKFRPAYKSAEPFEYLAGDVWLQAWAPRASSETRLAAVRPFARAVYDPQRYGDQMFYLNSILREWAAYEHGVPPELVPGLDHCFDCAAEVRVWRKFLRRGGGESEAAAAVAGLMKKTARALGRGLDRDGHGAHPGLFPIDVRSAASA